MMCRCETTGEVKEYFEDGYKIDTSTMHGRDSYEAAFYRASDGTRIDKKPDGRYQDKWGSIWVPQSPH